LQHFTYSEKKHQGDVALWIMHHHITWWKQKQASEKYNHNTTYIIDKILELHYNSAVPDAMEICSVIINYILIRPKSV